jgi:maltooligosyltrehalose trehalohydrolase
MCESGDRLVLVNLGRDIVRSSLAEPLAACPDGDHWKLAWSSEDPRYGGGGTPEVDGEQGFRIPAHSTVVLKPGGHETESNDSARGSK